MSAAEAAKHIISINKIILLSELQAHLRRRQASGGGFIDKLRCRSDISCQPKTTVGYKMCFCTDIQDTCAKIWPNFGCVCSQVLLPNIPKFFFGIWFCCINRINAFRNWFHFLIDTANNLFRNIAKTIAIVETFFVVNYPRPRPQAWRAPMRETPICLDTPDLPCQHFCRQGRGPVKSFQSFFLAVRE